MGDYSLFPDIKYAENKDIRGRATFPHEGTQPVWCDPTHLTYPWCMAADFTHPPPTASELGGTYAVANGIPTGNEVKYMQGVWDKMIEVANQDPTVAQPVKPFKKGDTSVDDATVRFCKDIAPCTNAKQFDGINAGIILPNFPSVQDIREEESRDSCENRCADLAKIKNEECDMLRKRTALWLKNRGCPSIVRGYQKTKKRKTAKKANCTSCGNGKNGKKK